MAEVDKYLVVLAGAGLGGVLRFGLGTWVMARYGGRFPLATFLINVSGSFLIGVLMTLFAERWPHAALWRLFLVVGLLGGYTTFSSFEFETLDTVRDGAYLHAILYVGGSVVLGYFAAWVGAVLAASRA